MRHKALDTAAGPTHRLWEVKFGSHQVGRDQGRPRGRCRLADVVDARGDPGRPDGGHRRRRRAARLHVGGRVAGAGLVQARLGHRRQDARPAGQREQRPRPDLGGARRHDHAARRLPRPVLPGGLPRGGLDPAVPKLVKELSADSVDDYVDTLEHEVWKYTVKDPNYGKAARRMYNVFRMNGKYREASYIRELFDEPVTALYQVSALIRTLDDAAIVGRHVRRRHDGRADRLADHVGDPGARRAGGGPDGRATCSASGTRSSRARGTRAGPTRWPASRTRR